ncbi:WhiB family transcriptional regulator [Ornithinimicrobium murale]|uniref:WhiB family transcriptional regulator n=1 Tax=Ornithinimicrobium murale TaxID=1050153 RepID=UPI001EDD1D09|nr:WhiB family transcriptional regulator [Ornithinimicrobium murale]
MPHNQRDSRQLAQLAREAHSLPCRTEPDLFFAERPQDLDRAKALCAGCPLREMCLQTALELREPWGVWGGELLENGRIIPHKRPRGRPRKDRTAA